MKVMIWIPDELVQEIKDSAWGARTSVSNYLVLLHRDKVGGKGIVIPSESHEKVTKAIKEVFEEPTKKEVISKLRDSSFFNPHSKDQQVGKK